MSLRRLNRSKPSNFDPLVEAKRVFTALGFDQLATEAYVFGSATDDTFSDESDIDVLVVFESSENMQVAKSKLLQRPLSEWPFDWIFKLRDEFEKRSQIGGVCYIAKNQGVRIL